MSYSSSVIVLAIVGFTCLASPVVAEWGDDLDGGVAYPIWPPLVTSAVDFAGDLVVGGRFDQAGGIAVTNVARWDGSVWTPLGSGLNKPEPLDIPVQNLAVHDDNLYATGGFTTDTGAPANLVARWKVTAWEPLAQNISPDLDSSDDVHCLISYAGALFIGGEFSDAGTDYQFARWAQNGWEFIPSPFNGYSGDIVDMAVFDDRLWAVGTSVSTDQLIANWDGENWTTILDDATDGSGRLHTICAHWGSIYVGGYFTVLDGNPINLLARYNGSTWEPGYNGILEAGFWVSFGFEPTWIDCNIRTLLSVGDRLLAGGLISGSSAGGLYGKMSVGPDGSIEQLGGELHAWDPGITLWPTINAFAYFQGQVIIGGEFNADDDYEHELGSLIGQLFDISAVPEISPAAVLRAPTPNPFNPRTTLSFFLVDAGSCRLEIFDLSGRLVRTLCAGTRTAGEHRFDWNGSDYRGKTVASGAYMARLTTDEGAQVQKLMLAK